MTTESFAAPHTRRDGKSKPHGPDLGLYTKFPSKLFGSGTAAALGPTVTLVYIALCEHANRNKSNTFRASDNAVASDTGLGTRTIHCARKSLIENKLISAVREKGQSYVYTLRALSLRWVPLNERPRPKRGPRALHAHPRTTTRVQQTPVK